MTCSRIHTAFKRVMLSCCHAARGLILLHLKTGKSLNLHITLLHNAANYGCYLSVKKLEPLLQMLCISSPTIIYPVQTGVGSMAYSTQDQGHRMWLFKSIRTPYDQVAFASSLPLHTVSSSPPDAVRSSNRPVLQTGRCTVLACQCVLASGCGSHSSPPILLLHLRADPQCIKLADRFPPLPNHVSNPGERDFRYLRCFWA